MTNFQLIIYVLLSIISVVIIIGIVIYAILYNRNANKVLKSGKPNVLLDKGVYINMFVTFGILIMSVFLVFQVLDQKEIIEDLNCYINQLQNEIRQTRASVSSLEREISEYFESQKNVYNQSFSIGEVNVETRRVEVSVKFSLREISKNSILTLKATNKLDPTDVVEGSVDGIGNYEGTLDLLINGEYIVIVIEETSESIKTHEINTINMNNYTKVIYKTDIQNNENGDYILSVYQENTNVSDIFKITDIKLEVSDENDKVIYSSSISLVNVNNKYSINLNSIIDFNNKSLLKFKITAYNQFGEIEKGHEYIITLYN